MRQVILHDKQGNALTHRTLLVHDDVGALIARDTRVALGERFFIRSSASVDDGVAIFIEVSVEYLTGDYHPSAAHPPR